MSFLDKFLDGVRLVDDDIEDDIYEEDYEEEEEEKRGFFNFGKKKKLKEDYTEEPVNNLTPMRGGKSSKKMQICIFKPTAFDDVREISDTLLNNCAVILNMEGVDLSLAQRIIDFMMGSCYAIDGNLQKISNFMFIITPAAVGISGDVQGIIDAFEESQKLASGGGFASF